MKRVLILIGLAAALVGFSTSASAIAKLAGLQISTDNRSLFFGLMRLGEGKELAQFGSYHNVITCSSTGDRSWYLKVHLLMPLSSGSHTIPLDNFQWQLVWTNGTGTVPKPYRMNSFGLTPDLVYLSGAAEDSGSSIDFRFKYSLTIPEAQASGVYTTTIRFTLSEIL